MQLLLAFIFVAFGSLGFGQPQESRLMVEILCDRQLVALGETLFYQIRVTNNGNLRVDNIVIDDNLAKSRESIGTLSPRDSRILSRSHTIDLADVISDGILSISVHAEGKDEKGQTVAANAYKTVPIAAIFLEKKANPAKAEAGTDITYTFTIRNIGGVAVTLEKIIDDKLGTITLNGSSLARGEIREVSIQHALADDPSGIVKNIATAYGQATINGETVTVTAQAVAEVKVMKPSLKLEKIPDKTQVRLGDTITYTFQITNDGDFPITDIQLTDDKLGSITLNSSTLQPGGKATATASYSVDESDLPGPIVNVATVRGSYVGTKGPGSLEVKQEASVNIIPPGMDNITFEKKADPAQAYPGDKVIFTLFVKNGDNATRSFFLDDPLLNVQDFKITLKPGETWSKSYEYIIPAKAPNPVVNVAYLRPYQGTGKMEAQAQVRVVYLTPSPGDPEDPRNQAWDVSFAFVKVYDTQVLNGAEYHMYLLDGSYKRITEIPVSGTLYLEVEDPDQNEIPSLRELIFGAWNKDSVFTDNALNAAESEHSYPIWPKSRSDTDDRLTPGAGKLASTSISGILPTAKIFIWNVQTGRWEQLSLRETAVASGVFRSTTCVPVSGKDSLDSSPGDTLIAFYQDPSNHSDVAIVTIKVTEGGSGAVNPPKTPTVTFDRSSYYPGDTITITVVDEDYAEAPEIKGKNILVLDRPGGVIKTWDRLEAVKNQPGRFRVTYQLPPTLSPGPIIAVYTDPVTPNRTAQSQANVLVKGLDNVTGVSVAPNPFSKSTTFALLTQPPGVPAAKITVTIYDLTGTKVAEFTGENTDKVSWTGGNLRNGAYIYVVVVEGGPDKVFGPFKGFVYIER